MLVWGRMLQYKDAILTEKLINAGIDPTILYLKEENQKLKTELKLLYMKFKQVENKLQQKVCHI